jgi:hypothetical protein
LIAGVAAYSDSRFALARRSRRNGDGRVVTNTASVPVPSYPNDFVQRIRVPAYLIVAFLSVGSIVELLVASWPLRVHDVSWRLGILNSAAAASGTEMLAILILIVIAHLAESRAALWTGFFYSALAALGYLAAAGTFVLDALQMRARISGAELHRFDIAIGWALARFGIAEFVFLGLASGALWAARALGRELSRGDTANKIVVGVSGVGIAPVAR